MDWFLGKLDALIAAVVVAAMAIAASQGEAFITQYVQRLGGHLDEARANLHNIQTGLRYKIMSDAVRKELEAEAQGRVNALNGAYTAITQSNVFTRPLSLISHADPAIVEGTWHDFRPSLPVNSEGAVYIIFGIFVGFVGYEIVKFPVVLLFREPRRRKFRRRGS